MCIRDRSRRRAQQQSSPRQPSQPYGFTRPPPPQPPRQGECRVAGPMRPTARNGQGAAGRRDAGP
eukprot:15012617-Alexandrium_andersonii.AAC.1